MTTGAAGSRRLVQASTHNGCAVVTLCRGEALNALSYTMVEELRSAVAWASAEAGVRGILFRSENERAFCAGADIKESASLSDERALGNHAALRSLLEEIEAVPQMSVAAVGGPALGAGFELALSCDVIFASDRALFGLPETKVGLVPSGGGIRRLAQSVGLHSATDIILSGRSVSAPEALALGIAARVVSSENLYDTCLEYLAQAKKASPGAVTLAKRLARRCLDLGRSDFDDAEQQAWREARRLADFREGVAAFLEGRDAAWIDV